MTYRLKSDGTFESFDFKIESNDIQYDDVVDRSTFSLDSDRENARKSLLTGSSSVGSYDGNYIPDDETVRIRSGKYDKAEVQKIIESKKKDFKDTVDSEKAKKESEKVAELNKARQDFLDKQTGFTGQPEKE